MFGLGSTELLIILALVLVIFGAGKLPEIGSVLGQGLRSLRKAAEERSNEIDVTPEKGQDEKSADK